MATEYPNIIGQCPVCIEEAGFKYEKSIKGLRGDVVLYRCDNCLGICQRETIIEKKETKSLGFLVEGGE